MVKQEYHRAPESRAWGFEDTNFHYEHLASRSLCNSSAYDSISLLPNSSIQPELKYRMRLQSFPCSLVRLPTNESRCS